ncbi:MAG TPA: fused MFS/spermidine synthase, partial [Candidatus Polarisedimenticolia bacterium]|nr:fused MFS/spermidine synthase [Candidatus Polarisedimenticolia bacterium]
GRPGAFDRPAAPAPAVAPSGAAPGSWSGMPSTSGGMVRVALAAAALSGCLGALLQVGWTRVAALSFGSSVYALGAVLAIDILGLGIGPLIVRRRLGSPEMAGALAAGCASLVGLSSLLIVPLLGLLPLAAAWLSGPLADDPFRLLAAQFLLLAGLLLPPAIAQGAILPSLAILAGGGDPRKTPRAMGLAYAVSTWGSVTGFLLAGFVALPRLGARRTLIAASLLALLLAVRLALLRGRGKTAAPPGEGRLHRWPIEVRRPAAFLVLAAVAVSGILAFTSWDRSVLAGGGFLYGPVYRAAFGGTGRLREAMRRRGEILFYRESGESLVTVRRSPAGVLSLQINGKTEASTAGDMGTQLLAAHLPLLLHPDPREVLVIGLASGVTVGAAERHPIARLRVIELVPAVVEAARLFATANGNALDDPRLDLVLDDARGHLLVRPDRYDVITSQPSNPWIAGIPNLFTVEFYRLVRRRLRPGGLFCQWVQAYRLDPADFRGIVRSFLQVFPDATLWEESAGGGDYFLLGGDAPAPLDPERLRGVGRAAAWDDLRRGGLDGPADLLSRFVTGPAGLAALSAGARPQTDDDLYLETRAPLALFHDTLLGQVAALRRIRSPVLEILPAGLASRDPGLVTALQERLRHRDERLAMLESLRDSDLWELRDPFLAAGIEFLRAGLWTEAIRALSRASFPGNPGDAVRNLLLGEAYRAADLGQAAAVAWAEAVRQDPGLAPAWNALGRQLVAGGLLQEGRTAFETALRRDAGLASARNNLGAVLLRQGDLAAAESALRQALQSDPALAAARANLGLVLKRRGDRAGAESACRAALDLDPLNTDARYNLAVLLRDSGRQDEARAELSRLLSIDPTDREGFRLLRELDGG